MRRRTLICAVIIAIAAMMSATAQEKFSVSASIEPRAGLTDTQPIQLVIAVEGGQRPDIANPRLPNMTNLRVVNGPSISTQTSFEIVNFQARQSSRVTMVYTLMAERAGPAEIPAIELSISGSTYRTSPIRIDVAAGPTRPAPRGSGTASGSVAPPAGVSPGEDGTDTFLSAHLSRSEVYAGEPVLLDVTFYISTRLQATNLRMTEAATLAGFWSEDIRVDSEAEATRQEVEGRPYVAYPLIRKMLVPTAAGDLDIAPFGIEFGIPIRSRDPFQDFFGRRVMPVVRKSRPLKLTVKPLPDAGRPDSFGGAVGNFKVTVNADRTEARVNDAVALKIVVEGEGSLQGVPPPRLDPPGDLKVFDPKTDESTSVRGGKLSSRKSWEWVVVPLAPGAMKLPPAKFAYFDPKAGAYRELGGDALALAVSRGDAPEAPIARTDVRVARREIGWIKTGAGDLARAATPLHRRPLGFALLVFPIAALPLIALVGLRRARLSGNRAFVRARRAAARARRGLKEAEKMLASSDTERFHGRIGRALVEYVADRFDRSPEGLTYDVADELLASRGVDDELRRRFRTCLEGCDFARFVPGTDAPARRAETLREANATLDLLEKGS